MALPLMPKATAVWLVENTSLTFEQIAAFCGLHSLEVQAIADGEVAVGMVGLDPVANGQLTKAEIERCERNQDLRLKLLVPDLPLPAARSKGPRYTPITKRGDKPDAIAWLLKHHPELSDAQLCRLIGTTKPTIASVRERSHWNAPNIKPRNPVLLGLCTQRELEEALALAVRRGGVPLTPEEREAQDREEGGYGDESPYSEQEEAR
ncbi:DUF1013 domain-containing protein [Azospirillum rugosum]|uniref:DUF1013 domain-containing protein n=1 Tax=Azospirillum rugosum TaxID=416170 RepID=A0ABS4SL95_9PROT|nr:DUF1013 domain-containing protein [Azospirillum rugosum]MBP2292180.1 hypothetical protein [Azospirillum rugosum]MDQ0525684.1 hypothetical protein [Azospirillum rugosum]